MTHTSRRAATILALTTLAAGPATTRPATAPAEAYASLAAVVAAVPDGDRAPSLNSSATSLQIEAAERQAGRTNRWLSEHVVGRRVTLAGTVSNVSRLSDGPHEGQVVVRLDATGGPSLSTVGCRFPAAAADALLRLNRGDAVTVVGTADKAAYAVGTFMGTDVVFDLDVGDCRLAPPSTPATAPVAGPTTGPTTR